MSVEAVTSRLRSAAKYRGIHPDTVADVVAQESAHASGDADLERRARLRLHKVAALYLLQGRPHRLLTGLDAATAGGPQDLRAWCRAALATHFSTAERLPDLDWFYRCVFDLTGPAGTVIDVACAVNPLSLPWLREATGARYVGYDLNRSYVDLGNAFLARVDPESVVLHRDSLTAGDTARADVALLLKTYHCIEDRRAGAALRLVADLPARHVAVSFPVRARHGRAVDFARPHITRLETLAAERGWRAQNVRLSTEEIVVVTKDGGDGC